MAKSPKKKREKNASTKPKPKNYESRKIKFRDYEELMGKRMPSLHRKRGGALSN